MYLYRKSQIEKIIAKRKSKRLQVEAIIDSARKVKHSESENSMKSVELNDGVKIPELNSGENMQELSLTEGNNNAVYIDSVGVDSTSKDSSLKDVWLERSQFDGKFNGGYQIDTLDSQLRGMSKC